MEPNYGIFMMLGPTQSYGQQGLSGKALVKLNVRDDFKSPEEAAVYISAEKYFDNKTDYFILPFYKYSK